MRRLALISAGFLLVVGACATTEPTIDEYAPVLEQRADAYADEVETLADQNAADLNSAVNRLQNDLQGDALIEAAVAETAALSSRLFAGIGDALDRYVRDLDEMATPASVEDEHLSYLTAMEASRSGIAPLLASLGSATSFDQIDQAIASSGFSDAQPRVEAACTTLEGAVESFGPRVDVRCTVAR